MRRNTDIEVLRAVAITFTLFAHFVAGLLLKLGPIGVRLHSTFEFWTGVDLFFAISGFVIATSLLSSTERHLKARPASTRKEQFGSVAPSFWIKRGFRLLPSAWAWLAITLLLSKYFNKFGSFGALEYNLKEAAAAVCNLANVYFYGWFSHHNSFYGSLGIYWSLSLEEQFYLVLPFLLFFLPRRAFIAALVAGFAIQFFASRPVGFDIQHTSFLWYVRTDALILGVLIALWRASSVESYQTSEPHFMRHVWISLPVFGTAIVLLSALPASQALAQISTGLIAVLSALLVLIASYDRDYLLKPSRFKSALVWLGSRSYAIYLIHTACRAFVLELKLRAGVAEGGVTAGVVTLASIGLIFCLAELNYRFLEQPLRQFGHGLADRLAARKAVRPVEAEAPRTKKRPLFQAGAFSETKG